MSARPEDSGTPDTLREKTTEPSGCALAEAMPIR
jgi:hypothetical protein